MHEGLVPTDRRVAAYYQLKKAKAGMEELIVESVRSAETRPLYDKLKKCLPTVTEAVQATGNIISDSDPQLDTTGQIRFEIEAEAVLAEMAATGEPRFVALRDAHKAKKSESRHFQGKSIQIRETQQYLKAALAMLDKDAMANNKPAPYAIARASKPLTTHH
jgi:hypothetical protein